MKARPITLMLAAATTAGTLISPSVGTALAGGKVQLSYTIWDANQAPAMKLIMKQFEQKYPNVQVTLQVTPWAQYWTKLQTEAQGGTLPDVFWMNGPNFQLYAANGMLKPLGNDPGINKSNYPSSLVKLYSYQGDLYGVPKDFDTVGLWYNKALFNAAHVPLPNSTWTWDSVVSAAKKLTNAKKGVYGIAAFEEGQEEYYDTIFQNGGYVISSDGKKSGYALPATIQGIQFWTNLINVDHVSPTLQQMTDTDPWSMFQSGKIAMIYGGDWNAAALEQSAYAKANIDVTVLPKGKVRATVIHGLGNVVAANTKHPTEALDFVNFLGSKQAAMDQASTGTVIPAFNGTQAAWVKAIPYWHMQIFLDELKYAVPYPVSKNTSAWQTAEPNFLNNAWTGKQTVQQASDALAAFMNQKLAKEH